MELRQEWYLSWLTGHRNVTRAERVLQKDHITVINAAIIHHRGPWCAIVRLRMYSRYYGYGTIRD